MKNKIVLILNNIKNLFYKTYSFIDTSYQRPAFIKYINLGYSVIKNDFDNLIINLEKEVDSMDARELVLAQLDALNKEKQDLVNAVLEAEKETIATIKLKAAEQAEAEYKEEVEVKVAHQFKIAEDHLNKLLESLPAETVEPEQSETIVFCGGEEAAKVINEEEPII